MTDREKAIVMAHTGICMLEGEKLDVFYQYLNELYGRPVYTHEWVTLDIKEKSRPDFLQLCKEEEPERRGRWIKHPWGGGVHTCSVCGERAEVIVKNGYLTGDASPSGETGGYYHYDRCELLSNYCPNCGARMEATE